MRSRHRPIGAIALIISGLSAALAGCSTGGSQESYSSAGLGPRPEQGMSRDEPRRYPDGSTSGGYYPEANYGRPYAEAPRRYVDPGQPTPREYASYDSGHGPYAPQSIQTGSLGGSQRTWQQPDRSRWPAPVTTGSTGSAAPHTPQIVEVREGDTLFGLSRRYNVPVSHLVAANRLSNERIAIGQRLVIPTRYR
jgi:LysM repeat protein